MPIASAIIGAVATIGMGVASAASTSSAKSEAKGMYEEDLKRQEENTAYGRRQERQQLGLQVRQIESAEEQTAYERRLVKSQLKKSDRDRFGNMLVERANRDNNFKEALWARWGK